MNIMRAGLLLIWASTCNLATAEEKLPIVQFVQQTYPYGVPATAAKNYQKSDAIQLLDLLKQPTQMHHHSNVLQTLGLIGAPNTTQHIIAYIEQGKGQLSATEFRAKSDALLALGYQINTNNDPQALQYLINSLDIAHWQRRNLQWNTAFFPDETSRDLQMARQAAVGLTLSGSPKAATALQNKIKQQSQENPDLSPANDATFAEMLKANQNIAADGLEAYLEQEQ